VSFGEVTIMHPSVLSRTVRSLYFRRRLADAIPALEAAVWDELTSRQVCSALIGGFCVCMNGTNLSIEPAPSVHPPRDLNCYAGQLNGTDLPRWTVQD
jgi:hypothetical protein